MRNTRRGGRPCKSRAATSYYAKWIYPNRFFPALARELEARAAKLYMHVVKERETGDWLLVRERGGACSGNEQTTRGETQDSERILARSKNLEPLEAKLCSLL